MSRLEEQSDERCPQVTSVCGPVSDTAAPSNSSLLLWLFRYLHIKVGTFHSGNYFGPWIDSAGRVTIQYPYLLIEAMRCWICTVLINFSYLDVLLLHTLGRSSGSDLVIHIGPKLICQVALTGLDALHSYSHFTSQGN